MNNPEALVHLRHRSVSDKHRHPAVPQQLKAIHHIQARPDMLTLIDPIISGIPVVNQPIMSHLSIGTRHSKPCLYDCRYLSPQRRGLVDPLNTVRDDDAQQQIHLNAQKASQL